MAKPRTNLKPDEQLQLIAIRIFCLTKRVDKQTYSRFTSGFQIVSERQMQRLAETPYNI